MSKKPRTCQHCGGNLPCLTCRAALKQRWAEENRVKSNLQKKAYADRFPDRVKVANRNWYDKQAEKGKWKNANRERVRENDRKQYANDPAPFNTRNARRKERDKQVGGTFTVDDIDILMKEQRGLCANPHCGADLSMTGYHADHVVPVVKGGSHDIRNRQLLCPPCNHRKGIMTNEQWNWGLRAETPQSPGKVQW